MNSNTEKVLDMLCKENIRPSYQRIKILEYLFDNKKHPTADMIYTELQNISPIISRATVYNTLNLFVEKGLVNSVNIDKNETRYDLLIKKHGHFFCNTCGNVYDFDYSNLSYNKLDNFNIEKEEVLLKGICKYCTKNN